MAEDGTAPWTGASSGRSILAQIMNLPPDASAGAAANNFPPEASHKAPHGNLLSGTLSATFFRARSLVESNANLSAGGGQQLQQRQLCPSDLLCECGADGRILGSATAYVLGWTKVAIRKLANAYLASPALLALTPLLLGLAAGFALGRRWERMRRGDGSVAVEESAGDGGGGNGRGGRRPRESVRPSKVASAWWPLARMAVAAAWEAVLHFATARRAEPSGDRRRNERVSPRPSAAAPREEENDERGRRGGKEDDDDEDVAAAAARPDDPEERDSRTRTYLLGDARSSRESGVDLRSVPRHVAVIMDGNRRYGRARYGSATRGHWDGSRTLVDFSKWCIAEGVRALTVYAFSTENWNRSPEEVDALMKIFVRYCDELRVEAVRRDIRLRVLSTETERIPEDVRAGLERMVDETRHCSSFLLNICLSYGGRGEIVNACRSIARDVREGDMLLEEVTETALGEKMLTFTGKAGGAEEEEENSYPADPDVVIRTSGELRLSNFLLWQAAYSELFFVDKPWPALQKEDLLEIIRSYAMGRKRRFGI